MSFEQKIPFVRSLPQFAQRKVLEEIAKRGQSLPGHVVAVAGPIVTVNLDVAGLTLPQVTMPLFGPEYIRYPVQVGDKGVCFPCSVYIGGVSGLGAEVAAPSTLQGNLSTLVWFPIGNKNWSAVDDPDKVVIYGPNGVELRDTAGAAILKVDATNGLTLSFGGHQIVINSSGVIIDGKTFLLHEHLPGTYIAGSNPVTGDSGAVL